MEQTQKIAWKATPNMTADYPIILKDVDTQEPYLHYKKRKIKVSELTKLSGWE